MPITCTDARADCAEKLFALALKEKNVRAKRYLLDRAREIGDCRSMDEIMSHLFDLVVEAALKMKESDAGDVT